MDGQHSKNSNNDDDNDDDDRTTNAVHVVVARLPNERHEVLKIGNLGVTVTDHTSWYLQPGLFTFLCHRSQSERQRTVQSAKCSLYVVWFIPFDGILEVLQLLMYGVNVGIVRSTSTAQTAISKH